ncbi:AMP-binding protein [Streptomyces sp.]|uniref:AMP-binding protein n=1 Tax=Streptomyces sp. TaxID=1931 RepID=UPI002F41EB89
MTASTGLHDLVIRSAGRSPDAPAVHGPDGAVTYRELDRLADRFAAALAGRGVRPGDRVVLWSHKSVRAVALMQAALRVGAVYVPVSGANPPSRVGRIAADCGAVLIVADEDAAVRAGAGGPELPGLTELTDLDEPARAGTGAGRPVRHASGPDAPAYILYTSGSTGMPKGVCVSHGNALAFVEWAAKEAGVGPRDRLSNHAPFNFDLSVFDLYAAFLAGAEVSLIPQEMAYAPEQLAAFVRERRITVWYSVPSVLGLMLRSGVLDAAEPAAQSADGSVEGSADGSAADLRVCVFAGEPFPVSQVRRLRAVWPGVRLLNWYGPTETNVCTAHEVTDADLALDRPLPIGRPCAGDSVALAPDDTADEGELVVCGPTVMLGYWGREPQRGPYPTGDLVRRDADGTLHYLGRRDLMEKVRGHRIEPGEIENALGLHPAVADACVLVAGSGLDAALHAVVVPAGERPPSVLEIKRHCAERLPTYMIVNRLHIVAELPRTPNGKVDRRRLTAAVESGELR